MTKIAGSEILQMSLDCLPKHGASSLETLHEAVPTDQQAVANQNYSIPLGFCRDIDDLKEREETLGHCHRKTMRGTMSSWLQCLLVAAALAWTMPAAWGADIRVAFINPTGPPEFWRLVSATMRAAAAELGISVEEYNTERSFDNAIAVARDLLGQRPPPDYLIATNDVGVGAEIVKLANAAGVPMILLNNDLDEKQWAEYGEPRTKYRHWLGSIVPDHESGGYGIAEAILIEAVRIKKNRPLKLLALAGEVDTPASNDRLRGLKRAIGVMRKLLGPDSVELIDIRNLDWTEKSAEASVREFVQKGPRIDALWAANDPMALGAITALREAGYDPGADVVVGGLNWSQGGVERVLKREMVLTHGGHFLVGAWAMVILRDYHDGRDFAEEDVRLQFPMGAFDLPVARRFSEIGKVDWRKIDFTRFSKVRNGAVTRYNFTPDAVLSQLESTH
jgi:ABC-type sugar transport system substrate-binding protein